MAPLDLKLLPGDAYYFIAHDHMIGKGRPHPRVPGIGLGAALLGELVLAGHLQVQDGNVYVVRRDPPSDVLLHTVQTQLLAQPQHRELSTWLAFLAVTALDNVTERLRMKRLLKEVEQRRIIGRRRVLVPADANEAAWQAVRLERLLNTNTRMGQADCFLAGLVSATGLMRHVLWDPETNHVGYGVLPFAIGALDPSLLAVVKQTEAAVGQAVLAPR
jgi:hypothetical protein